MLSMRRTSLSLKQQTVFLKEIPASKSRVDRICRSRERAGRVGRHVAKDWRADKSESPLPKAIDHLRTINRTIMTTILMLCHLKQYTV